MGIASFLKRFIRAVVPHIIILSVLFGYLTFGAAVFTYLETGHSDLVNYKSELGEIRDKIMSTKVVQSPNQAADYDNTTAAGMQDTAVPSVGTAAPAEIGDMVDELMDRSLRPEWKVGRMQAVQSERAWSFASSMLFCLTTVTTIGYGDIVPVTVGGKVFCVIYSVFGIPLTMLYLGGVGSFLAHLILTLCKILHLGQPIRRVVCPCVSRDKKDSYEAAKSTIKKDRSQKRSKNADEGATCPENGMEEAIVVTTQHGVESADGPAGRVEDEMEAPVLLVVAIMTGYMCTGAFLMSGIEDWTYGEALYFTFITLTTIGFGDYVPVKLYREDAFFACIVYALFGLAVMSMCIALVQAKVRRLGSRVWDCTGC